MRSNKTKERILDVSLRLFNERKASNVSTVQISTAMKISPGNLYYYYANKEELIRCIWNERMRKDLEKIMYMCQQINTAGYLLDFLKSVTAYCLKYKFFYTEMPTLFFNDSSLVEIYKETKDKVRESLTALYLQWEKEGKVKEMPDNKIALIVDNSLSLMLVSVVYSEVMYDRISDRQIEKIAYMRMYGCLESLFTDRMHEEMEEALSLEEAGEDEEYEINT